MNNLKLIEFTLGTESFCLDLALVREVISGQRVFTPIPLSPRYIAGLLDLRGNIFKIIDLRKKLAINSIKGQEAIILFDIKDKQLGVIVDGVKGILNVTPEQEKIEATKADNEYFPNQAPSEIAAGHPIVGSV